MKKEGTLSIIIPVYNGAKEIVRCLNSIFGQNVSNSHFEVICVDDCSVDNTIEVIAEYKRENGYSNLNIIKHSVNKRQGGARNTGVKAASGSHILYLDHDDYLKMVV